MCALRTALTLTLTLSLLLPVAAPAQTPPVRARLAPVPIDVAMQATIAGLGDATATLAGTTLSVNGTYRGLVTPATSVRIYESARMGMRGTLVGEFASGGGTTGSFKGTVTLSADRAAAFAKGLLYVQIQSEKAPDGNLRGWFMPSKGRR
jgi:hypothetical protein